MSDPVEGVDGGGADDADGADEEFDGDDRDDLDDDLDEEGSWFLLDADDPTVEGEVGEEAEVAGMPEVGTWSWQVPLRRVAMAEILGDRAWLDELDDSSLAGLLDADGDPLNPADVVVYADQLLTSLQELLADDELSLEDFARLHWVTIDLAVISRTADDATGGSSVALGNAASALDRLTRETDTMLRRRITLRRDGSFRLRWTFDERELVQTAIDRLDAVVDPGHEALARLYPAAYGEDEQRSAEYAAVAHHELIDSRRAAFQTVRGCLRKNVITADELGALMRSVNDVRLVLGTQLDVTEDDDWLPAPEDPNHAEARTYFLLTALLGDIISAMRRSL